MSARLIPNVIEATANRGKGVDSDPIREVTSYYLPDGTLLAENDPYAPSYDRALGRFLTDDGMAL
jgi:hypothetical protein